MSSSPDVAEANADSQNGWEPGLVRGFECAQCKRTGDSCFAVIRSRDLIHLFCQRVVSDRTTASGRYLHELTGEAARDFQVQLRKRPTKSISKSQSTRLRDQAISFHRRGAAGRATLAVQLGVSEAALHRLGVGFTHGFQNFDRTGCYSAPERDAFSETIDLHLRKPDGTKFQAGGGRRGLFYDPESWQDGTAPILAVEGLSDVAAGPVATGRSPRRTSWPKRWSGRSHGRCLPTMRKTHGPGYSRRLLDWRPNVWRNCFFPA